MRKHKERVSGDSLIILTVPLSSSADPELLRSQSRSRPLVSMLLPSSCPWLSAQGSFVVPRRGVGFDKTRDCLSRPAAATSRPESDREQLPWDPACRLCPTSTVRLCSPGQRQGASISFLPGRLSGATNRSSQGRIVRRHFLVQQTL